MSRIVGRYEILQKLGEGGMADVYLARQIDLDRSVALKELRVGGSSDPAFAKRFLREARMAGSLSHPNIVTVHDYIASEGTPFIAMEYMERGSLRAQIGHMTLAQIGGVLEGLLAGLDYAGRRGIVHRDIKPENVMIGADGRVKIADFGIAKARNAFQTGGSLTAEGTALGTPNYMSPEQAYADEVGPATDIYAAGVMSFEMFVGRPPFADTPQPLVVIMRQVRDPIPRVTDLDPAIDPLIADWIAWLTAKEPAQRPQSAAQAWERFEEILVAKLGSRWRRGALLLPVAAMATQVATAPGPTVGAATEARTTRAGAGAVAAGALAGGALAGAAFATPPTQPLEDPRLTPTMPANPQLLGINRTEGLAAESPARAPGKRRRGGRRGIALAAIAAVLLLAVVASGAMRRGANLGRPAADTHAARSRTTPAKSPAASDLPTGTATPTTTGAKATETPVSGTTGAASRGHDLSAAATEAHTLAGQYNAAAAKIESLKATGAEAGQNAILANLLLQTASAYSKAERAATRGDEQGYANAIADAKVAKGKLDQASQAPAPASSSAPSSSGSASSGQGSSCAGDSQSDDPSDDSCGGEP